MDSTGLIAKVDLTGTAITTRVELTGKLVELTGGTTTVVDLTGSATSIGFDRPGNS